MGSAVQILCANLLSLAFMGFAVLIYLHEGHFSWGCGWMIFFAIMCSHHFSKDSDK